MTDMTIKPIYMNTTAAVHRWTFDAYLAWVKHEAMFHDSCERVENIDHVKQFGVSAQYKLKRNGTGFNGHATEVETTMTLIHADGDVPAYSDEDAAGLPAG